MLDGGRMGAAQKRIKKWGIGGAALGSAVVAYATPPAIYYAAVSDIHWGEFWRSAATPYGAATAGFAALTAGGLAYYNGERQRRHDAANVAAQLAQSRDLDDRRHAADRNEALRARYSTAAEQIGHADSAIQLAGVISLAALADVWGQDGSLEDRQACIDLLCSVLRSAGPQKDSLRLAIVDSLFKHLHLQANPSWKDCGINLRGAEFSDTRYLRGIRLPGANLVAADLRRSDLDGIMLDNARMMGAQFANARLAGARLRGANISGANFQDANMGLARLQGARARGANFHGAVLAGTDLRDVDLESIGNLSRAKHLDKCIVTDSQRRFIDQLLARGSKR